MVNSSDSSCIIWVRVLRAVKMSSAWIGLRRRNPGRSVRDQLASTGLWFHSHCWPRSFALNSSLVWGLCWEALPAWCGMGPELTGSPGDCARGGLADDGPVVFPADGFEMQDASVGSAGLEVNEPSLTVFGLNPAALMWAVDVRAALCEDGSVLVWSVDGFGAKDCLSAGAYTSEGSEDVVVTVPLVELWTFERGEIVGIADDLLAFVEDGLAVGRHAMEYERACTFFGVHEVCVAIVVPEGAWVFEPGLRDHCYGVGPGAGDCGCGAHEDAFVGRREEDVEAAVVLSDGGSPDSLAVAIAADHVVLRIDLNFGEDVRDDGPVHEILRLKDWNSWDVGEG